MSDDRRDDPPILLTPGPLTTRLQTRRAMLRDWGSRDRAFIALTAQLRAMLLAVVHGGEDHVAVPLQGSGTFIVEAALATLMRPQDKLLVLVNGAYGERMVKIAQRHGRAVVALRWPEDVPVDTARIAAALASDSAITHVALVHCETTSGLLNPLEPVAELVARSNRHFILDAMSSFGAIAIDLGKTPVTAVLASSNKCLEGVPGLGFAIVARGALAQAKGNSPSLSFDLYEQWQGFEANGQWRFTPPVQVVAALVEALCQLEQEGGPSARLKRYAENFAILSAGMQRLGFVPYLNPAVQAPVIATFRMPQDGAFVFRDFYDGLAARGFLIYPGKLTQIDSFRIGCIGALDRGDFVRLLEAIEAVIRSPSASARGG